MLNYLINGVAVAYALLGLAKDWQAHRTTMRRLTGLGLLLVAGIFGAVQTHRMAKSSEDLKSELLSLKDELAATRRMLNGPKAELQASFGDVQANLEKLEVREKLVQRQQDGTLELAF